MRNALAQYGGEVKEELEALLLYWMKFTPDNSHGGFVGRIDHDNNIDAEAPKGSVLNSRILWAFSSAYKITGNPDYLATAERACNYLLQNFIDKEFGGVYWTVDYTGEPLDTKKQIYALSFAVYGLSEYYKVSGNEKAKGSAVDLYRAIVEHSFDNEYGGFIEALSEDWKDVPDLRLSNKDANEKKSMNTNLHVLEGFANLYRIWPDNTLRQHLVRLVQIFLQHIISPQTGHLVLFFNEQWNPKSAVQSYGHDIEAAWLVQEATELLNDEPLLQKVKAASLLLANAAIEGLDSDGGLWYEYDLGLNHLIREKHWWPQAEAMVGFYNAWQLTGDEKYLQHSLQSWEFIKKRMLDKKGGEWYWGVNEDYSVMDKEDKVGIWKCPYHNSRACMEIIHRISRLVDIST